MSLYSSSFTLSKIEEQYNKQVAKLILLLQSDVLQFMSPHQLRRGIGRGMQRKRLDKYKEVFQKIEMFEEHKFLQPKFSQLCTPLKNLVSKISSKLCMQARKSERRAKSQKKTKGNQFNEEQGESQFDNIKSTAYSSNFYAESSRERFHQTKTEIGNRRIQQRLRQLKNFKVKNEPFSIFTIQEVSENVSRKDSMKKNSKLIQIPTDNSLDFKSKQKKKRVFKSNQEYKNISQPPQHNNDEPFFPSYRKLSSQSIKDQYTQQNCKRQSHYERNQIQSASLQRTSHQTGDFKINQTYLSSQVQTIHKMKSFTVNQLQKPVKQIQKSSQFIKMRYKKLIDKSNFQKLYVKRNP